MKIPFYQIDAFTHHVFGGNPAAVMPLEEWLDDKVLQNIAAENNLSETVFFVPSNSPQSDFDIRWFTPTAEVDLCGHATLAAAHLLFTTTVFSSPALEGNIRFSSRSGILTLSKSGDKIMMDFPTARLNSCKDNESLSNTITQCFGTSPISLCHCDDLIVEFATRGDVASAKPDINAIKQLPYRGVLITARGEQEDFVARFFAPNVGIDEDPATGSAYTALAPFWAEKLGKQEFHARQLSARGAEIHCALKGDRVHISGAATHVIEGSFRV